MCTNFFSAPGRTEISGNHTDHPLEIDLNDLEVRPEEMNATKPLVRGVAAAFQQRGADFKESTGGCSTCTIVTN